MNQNGGFDPCYECPAVKMDSFLETMPGRRIALVVDLDRSKQAGIVFGPEDITHAEALLMRILNEERDKYTEELMKESSKKRS